MGTLDKLNSQLLFQKKNLICTFEGFGELFHRQFTLLNFESFKLFDIQVSYKELFLNYAKGRHSKSKGWNYHKSIHFCTTKIHKIQVSSGIIHERRIKFDMQMIWRKSQKRKSIRDFLFYPCWEKSHVYWWIHSCTNVILTLSSFFKRSAAKRITTKLLLLFLRNDDRKNWICFDVRKSSPLRRKPSWIANVIGNK